ncbi:PerC family transcriptional regulator [Enterobacter hormaechei]
MMAEDEVAQKLEAAGLWRRAASRWLDVMKHYALTESQREWNSSAENFAFPAWFRLFWWRYCILRLLQKRHRNAWGQVNQMGPHSG